MSDDTSDVLLRVEGLKTEIQVDKRWVPIVDDVSYSVKAGQTLGLAGAALVPFADELWVLILIRVVHGAAFGVVGTLTISGVLARVPSARRGEAAGYLGLPSTISTAVGPLLATLFIAHTGYEGLFVFCIAVTVVAALAAIPLRLPLGRRTVVVEAEVEAASMKRNPIIARELRGLSVVMVLVGFAYSGVIAYLIAFATSVGVEGSIGLYFALYAGVALCGRLLLGRIQDRFGDNVVVIPLLVCFAASLIVVAGVSGGGGMAVAGILMGLGFGMFIPTMQAAAARSVTADRMNTAVATVFLSVDLGVGFGPLLLGLLIPVSGYRGMYLALAAVVVVAGLVYVVTHGRRAGRRAG